MMKSHPEPLKCVIISTIVVATLLKMTNAECNTDAFYECDGGRCIPIYMRCDDRSNCPNGDDEVACDSVQCTSKYYPYRCSSGKCIPQKWVCDLYFTQHCPDGEDQMNCDFPCRGEDYFQCADSVCIYSQQRCDAIVNCPDGSDERGCECKRSQFTCNNGACISKRRVCDQDPDCPDQEDEEGCKGARPCDEFSFRCDNGVCILGYQRCDGANNCIHGEDEKNCHSLKCFECDGWYGAGESCGKHIKKCDEGYQCATTYKLLHGQAEYTSDCASEEYCSDAHSGRGKCDLGQQSECTFCCNNNRCNKFNRRPSIIFESLKCFECDGWHEVSESCTRNVKECEAGEQCSTTYRLNQQGGAEYTSGCASLDYCSDAHSRKRKCDVSRQDECIFCCHDGDKCNKFTKRPKITMRKQQF